MNILFFGHVALFLVAAGLCFASLPRARTIQHRETRDGFVAVLITCGLWASGYVGYFVLPGPTLKVVLYTIGLIAALACVGAWLYFSAAYTGRSLRQAPYRRGILGIFLALVLVKITNPIHNLYFTTEWATDPFPHLAIQQGVLHWVVLGASYVAIGISFFMLLERFYYAGADTTPLVALLAVTALPIGLNILSVTESALLPFWYEPIGVAVFAVGTLFVYRRRFEAIQWAGESDTPVIFLDQGSRIRDYNKAAVALFPDLEGAIGRPVSSVLPRVGAQLEDGGGLLPIEADDEIRFYQLSTSPFMTGDVVTGRLVSISDVTGSEQYKHELETKTEQLETLNRLVRHDIRNDMTVILAWAEMLSDHVDEEGEDAVTRIRRKSEHVVELTDVARDVVNSLTDARDLELAPIDLAEYLDLEVETARETYPDARFHVPTEIPPVSVQANEMLESVFRNLLNNAVQHNDKETPEITVTVEEHAATVHVRVADNGPGIPDPQKDGIFGKGEKGLDSSGTGIGLYLVNTLVESYDGAVWIEDAEPEGAIFVVELVKYDE
jgi:signal transduction histidine kinase